MTEYRLFSQPVADVQTIEMCLETFHRYRAEYQKRHGKRPEMAENYTPHEGGITYVPTEEEA